MKLREYKSEDYRQVINLLKASWADAYHFIPENDREEYLNSYYTRERFEIFVANPNITNLVAEENGKIAGWMRLEFVPVKNEFHLSSIYVSPDFTGQGTGTKMINEAFKIARQKGHKKIWLGVMKQNLPALRWYKKLGFEFIKEEPFRMGSAEVLHLIGYKEI